MQTYAHPAFGHAGSATMYIYPQQDDTTTVGTADTMGGGVYSDPSVQSGQHRGDARARRVVRVDMHR